MATLEISSNNTATVTSPWGKINSSEKTKSFNELMSEEYAKQLEDESKPIETIIETTVDVTSEQGKVEEEKVDLTEILIDGTENDDLLAQMLQLEFDRENDDFVKSAENLQNGTSKVSMSYQKFCTLHPFDKEYSDNRDHKKTYVEEDWEDSEDDEDYTEEDNRAAAVGRVKIGHEIITKHDALVTERKNAKNVEKFPLNFPCGDVSKKDIRLPNHVYNRLKVHSKKEERNEMRVHEKQEHSTHERALDENTRLILYKMVNNGTLDSLSGIISTGKEAVVIHAKGGSNDDGPLPSECALKVFKTTLNEFKTRERYICEDHRFRARFSKQNPRKIIKLWAEKEYRNLKRMEEAGLNTPHGVLLRKHILIMSFIGVDRVPAQKLKEVRLSNKQYQQAYLECINFLKALYKKCNLIHADFSEYNILWHNHKCHFIDVSQSIEPTHPHAYHFLLRDCRNCVHFFTKVGVPDVMGEAELFKYVCGKELDITNLDEIESECQTGFERDKELLTYGIDTTDYSFDYHFSASNSNNELVEQNSDDDQSEDDQDEATTKVLQNEAIKSEVNSGTAED